MWRAGFDLALLAWGLNVLALSFGALLGARALIDPKWAARFVRLQADEQGGGFAEFRATYGGLFLASHGAALVLSLKWVSSGEFLIGVYAAGAAAALAAAWIGTSGGRVLAGLFDGARTRFNYYSAGVEFLVGLMIAAPWLVWGFRSPG